jgi:Holliday junction DNA helicase RuvA
MIGSLRGPVTHIGPDYVVVELGGVGYRVMVAPKLMGRLRPEGEAHFFVHHLVREDQQALFGFGSPEELAFFELLMTVSGVGRKTAQRIGLELKEKIHAAGVAVGPGGASDSDVVAALESLGYTAGEARRAAGSVALSDGGLDTRIKAALQELARSR